jgi:uncharacterized Fe-S cluster-containing radical SAM superfamily protein
LLVSFVTISAALAAFMVSGATRFVLVAYLRNHQYFAGMVTAYVVGALLFSTASWAGWNRRWPLALGAFVGGFLAPVLILFFWYARLR